MIGDKKQPANFLLKDTLLAMVKNSVGSKTWQNFFMSVDGKKTDIMKGGDVSCAFFVSTLLNGLELIKTAHTTVNSTLKDMADSGWQEIPAPRSGAVILWAEKITKGQANRHLGFCLSSKLAVSNSSKTKKIAQHHITFGPKGTKTYRLIEKIFWNERLEK